MQRGKVCICGGPVIIYPYAWEQDGVQHMLGSFSRVSAAFEGCVNGNVSQSTNTLCRHAICTVKYGVRSVMHTKQYKAADANMALFTCHDWTSSIQ